MMFAPRLWIYPKTNNGQNNPKGENDRNSALTHLILATRVGNLRVYIFECDLNSSGQKA